MIETLAHPLNRARLDNTDRLQSGYTIIQPSVIPSLPSTCGSPFSRLFSNPVGIDPYTNTVSDAYQDLTGEGSYHGKGIYDVRAFSRVLSGRFPEAWLLSHDLIEGAHVRVGLASDLVLYDEFPQDYLSYITRQHRWIRGDWQIADWILPRVPRPGGGREPNPLSWFDRWKIFDNLRRSLLPAASLALLVASWFISSRAGWIAGAVVATQLLFHSLVQPFTWATTRQGLKGVSLAKVAHDLLRVVVEAALLPYQAWLALDAIVRVWYRRRISHRGLLEWTPAQAMHNKAQTKVPIFLLSMGLASVFSVLLGWAVAYGRPTNLGVAGPWLMLWFFSPMIGWLLSRRPPMKPPQGLIPEEDRQFLRNVTRRTWRYFSDFVNEETSWLPPDNYQISHQNRLALRTSPTNIGLYLVSVMSAHDFGYLTVDGVAQKLTQTMETIGKLERHEGHLLNWYDIKTLAPLNPRYVSTVDSGNLLGALWTLDQGLESLIQAPLLDAQAFAGLHDAGKVLRQVVREETFSNLDVHALDDLLGAWESPPDSITDLLRFLRRAESNTEFLSEKMFVSSDEQGSVTYWAGQVQRQLAAWFSIADRYLVWIEILAEKTEEEIAELDPDALPAFREALHHAPSLQELASGNLACITFLQAIKEKASANEGGLLSWIERVRAAFDRAKWLAGEMLALVEQLNRTCGELSESINMRFLYNAERRLFSIGFNVSEGRLDRAFYDLLASEARLGSFVAIARGDIPAEHWFAMSRPYGGVGRRRALLSWTGTMFEYMMPLLFQRSYGSALLDKATKEAVAIQIAHGRKHKVPWGISECAFGDLDIQKTYQYQAFGVPELGLKRGLADKIVVAPYASLLAVSVAPRETVKNLKRLADLGLLSNYGYYESLDYSQQPSHETAPGVIVRAYMAHHQGMSFLALTNFLHDDCLRRHFHTDPRVRTVEPLLHERIPHLPPLHHVSTRERVSSVASIGEDTHSVSQFETPHSVTPKTQLLCNGRYSLMLTGAGGGYSRWSDFDITRWRSDTTQDSWGTFCYIRDADSGRLWCNTYQPTGGKVEKFSANFTLDSAVFRRVDNDIESETEIVVAPEDDVEIRRITLTNRSTRTRRIELTSYLELALAPHNADRQHPAFNKLFIQTEAMPEQGALLAYRRPRSDDEPPIYVAHRFTLEQDVSQSRDDALRFETDRRRFIGRGRTLANPMGALQEPDGSQGFVLDPILSLRQNLSLAPGQRVQVSLVLAAGPSREQVDGLMSKYSDPHACAPPRSVLPTTVRARPAYGLMPSRVTCLLPWSPSPRRGIWAWFVKCSRRMPTGACMVSWPTW
jgi:cyclic beta-1,2-glucan synthetase